MKYIHSLAVLFVSQIALCQSPAPIQGPVDLKFIVTWQTIYSETSQSTKSDANSTNVITTAMDVSSNWVINNAKLLQIIGSAYGRPFVPEASLMLDQNTNFVVAVGSNVVLNLSNILTLSPNIDGSVFAGKYLSKQRTDRNGTLDQTEDKYVQSFTTTLNYDDSPLPLSKFITTHFSVKGVEKQRFNITNNGTNEVIGDFITFTGLGDGGVFQAGFDKPMILRGGFVGKLSGSQPEP